MSIKILYIANIRMPTEKAHGHQIMKMAELFSASQVDLELVLPTRINKKFNQVDPYDFYKVKKIFQIKKVFAFDPIFLLKFPVGLYIKCQSLFFMAGLVVYFFTIDRRNKLVYTRDEYLLPLLQLFFKSVIWEAHALPRKIDKYKKCFQRCHKIIVLTTIMKQRLINLGIEADKILVSPDAVDLTVFDINLTKEQARRQLNLPVGAVLLGYTGSFLTKGMDKGLADIFRALALISRPVKFIAVGGNTAEIDLYRRLAETTGAADRVELRGKVSQGELAIYQKAFDILLMPFPYTKHYAYFMSPLKMFEYLAARRPIIASSLPAIQEVLNKNNCLLVRPGDPKDLAKKIMVLINNPDLADKIANQSYQDARRYTWEERVDKILNFI